MRDDLTQTCRFVLSQDIFDKFEKIGLVKFLAQ